MTHLPTRLTKLCVLAASAAFGAVLFAGSANAGGYGHRYDPSYGQNYGSYEYEYPAANYGRHAYRPDGGGQDEIRELQRLFPSTNWPPSMRYHQD